MEQVTTSGMTAIAEAINVRLLIDSQAMVGSPRRGPKKEWTGREIKILRETYPSGGLAACLLALPGRSAGAIYQKAAETGLRKRNAGGKAVERRRYGTTHAIDLSIRQLFTGTSPASADIARLSCTLGRPRNWILRRAVALECRVPKFRGGPGATRNSKSSRPRAQCTPTRCVES